jgi:uncharacterized membrane-anchored protein
MQLWPGALAVRLNEHTLRRKVVGEMHLRRWPKISAPMQIIQVLRLVSREERAAERAMLHDLPQGGELAPFVNQRHAEGDLGEGLSFVWEQHSEACGITLSFAIHRRILRRARLARTVPGTGHPRDADAYRCRRGGSRTGAAEDGLRRSDLVSCHIGVTPGLLAAGLEPVRLWSDFRVGPEGLGVSLIAANGAIGNDLARLLQRFQELGNYRNLALMGLPVAQAHWPGLDAAEEALRQLATDVATPDKTDDALLKAFRRSASI